jgi:hypothetical protein
MAQVREIIEHAEALNRQFPPAAQGIDPTNADDLKKVVDYGLSPELDELEAAIKALTDEQRYELTALVFLGRGDGDDLEKLVEYARHNSGEGDVPYLSGKSPALPAYLSHGLAKL